MKPSSARFSAPTTWLPKPFAMVPDSIYTHGTASSLPNRGKEQPLDDTNDRNPTMRHTRWTRDDTIVLVEAKNVIESLSQEGQQSNEPKWSSVSFYCKQHGVDKEPVQCRKRWSSLIGEYKKIKTWESQIKEEADSFWVMRPKLKRERKLPASFDREVYDALEGRKFAVGEIPLATMDKDNGKEATAGEEETGDDDAKEAPAREEETGDEVAEAVFDSRCPHPVAEDGFFSDYEQPEKEEIMQGFEKEDIETRRTTKKTVDNLLPNSDEVKGKNPAASEWTLSMTQEGLKRRWSSPDGCEDGKLDQLIKVLERNGSLINEQVQAQNANYQLDRDQRKEQTASLVAAINKLTDAVVKITNRLPGKKKPQEHSDLKLPAV